MLYFAVLTFILVVSTAAQPNMVKLSVPSGTEGSQLTLTCQSYEDARLFEWLRSSDSTSPQSDVGTIWNSYKDESCVPESPNERPNSTLYSYSCHNRTTHTLTLMNVTSSNHGERWQCKVILPVGGGINIRVTSTNVTLSVQVPVTSVALSPSTNVTTLNVSQPATFECTVPRSLPSATIVWYKNSSGVISNLNHFTSVSSTPNPDRTVRTTGRLIFTPNTTDSGVGLYCTASSGGADMTSQQTLLNVQHKPSVPSYFNYTQHPQIETSGSFYWLPVYNGGFVQTFVIEYRKTGSQVWDQITVVEETSKQLMNATVDHLSKGTEYQARIFSRNKFGASDATGTLTFITPAYASANLQSLSQVGLIVGAVVPGVLLFVFIAVLIYLRLTNRICFTKKEPELPLQKNPADAERSHYEILAQGKRSTDVYSSLQDTTTPDNRFAQRSAIGTNDIELQEESAYQFESEF